MHQPWLRTLYSQLSKDSERRTRAGLCFILMLSYIDNSSFHPLFFDPISEAKPIGKEDNERFFSLSSGLVSGFPEREHPCPLTEGRVTE